jgi:hypothetical protein
MCFVQIFFLQIFTVFSINFLYASTGITRSYLYSNWSMTFYLSEYGKDITIYITYSWQYLNICQECLDFWIWQNIKGLGLKVLKRRISSLHWESYPSISVSVIHATAKILQSLNYSSSPHLFGGRVGRKSERQNSYLPHTPTQNELLEATHTFHGSVTPIKIPEIPLTAKD